MCSLLKILNYRKVKKNRKVIHNATTQKSKLVWIYLFLTSNNAFWGGGLCFKILK